MTRSLDAYDVAVIGGGIVGIAHAWMAARRGLRVLLLERTAAARGASVRNFGMIWPIGQPAGELYSLALRSREFWLELHAQAVVEVETCGSLHLAHEADELSVLEEFCERGTHESRMLPANDIDAMTPLANPSGLLGAMHSPTELRVDPRAACAAIARWLSSTGQADCLFDTAVSHVAGNRVRAADGRSWAAKQVVVCSGSDLRTLYPGILGRSGLRLCKLQMLSAAVAPSPGTPHIASGLTLRHYASFVGCPSLPALRARIAEKTPELDRYGIHVMASLLPNGTVILGDSHEYGSDISPFDSSRIDDLMLRELQRVIRLRDWTIQQRWHGVYAKHESAPVFEFAADDGVRLFLGPGGAGMTMAFGLAERAWKRWTGEDE